MRTMARSEELEGNDFLNNRRFKNVRLGWEGNFSIQNVRNFQNTADMMPQGLHENDRPSPHSNRPSSLSIATQSFSNGGNILATQNVSIACLEDFENSGRIWAQDVLLKLGRDFRNQGWINASSLLKIRVERDFYNNQSGRLEAPRLDISVGGVAWNSGKLTSHRLILAARILQNFGIVSLAKRGSVEAREFYNHKGARLVSEGSLTLRGGVFHNLGDAETKGYIHARSLVTRLTVLKNEGELLAHKKVNLHAASLQNGETGILRLTKGKIFAHVLYNKGAVSGVTLNGVIHTLENFGQFMFSKFKVALHFLFSNTKGALFSTSRRFIASGEGDFHNSGFLKSEGSTDIQVATLTNVGEISSEKTLSIKTREGSREDNADLENRGLIE